MRRHAQLFVVVLAVSLLTSCGGGGSSTPPPPPAEVHVSITSSGLSVAIGGTLQFVASVTGTTNTAVTWSVNGTTGGDATHGTITTGGLYTPPTIVPNPRSVIITATSSADASKSASATVSITSNVAVTVSPATANVDLGATQQFTANVAGTTNSTVTWYVGGAAGGDSTHGTITSAGLYTAPGTTPTPNTVTISAQSAVDSEKSGSATVTISDHPTVTITIYPQNPTIPVNGATQFVATVSGLDSQAVSGWSVNGVVGGPPFSTVGSITQGGYYTAPSAIPNPETVTISVSSAVDSRFKGSTTVTIAGPVSASVSPATVTLAAGAQQQFTATVNNTSNTDVDWQVNGTTGGNATVGTITDTGVYTASMTSGDVTISAVPRADRTKAASAAVSVLAPHRIAVRPVTNGVAEFYDRDTNDVYVPRGNNYIRLAMQTFPDGNTGLYHTTLNVGMYDAARVEQTFTTMQNFGYNVVRVYLNGCCHDNTLGDPAGGLRSAYIDNLVDFIERAAAHNIQVIVALDWVPSFGGYTDHYGNCTNFEVWNVMDLCKGGVDATTSFWSDFARALVQKKGRLDNLLAYQIREEYFFESDKAPLNWSSGTVTTANGKTYDMSDASAKQKMMDEGLVYWTDETVKAIKTVDPTALVTVGFFVPQQPNLTRWGDYRVIKPYPAIASSKADFVSLSVYPFLGDITVPQIFENFGFTGHQQDKPVTIGEYGALQQSYPIESDAATAMRNLQVQSCGYGIKGWLFWTWDTPPEEHPYPYFWGAMYGSGLINDALAPAQRPDPCQ